MLSTLYDQLESHMRALETLGIATEQSAIFLYPLIESSLPEELIKVWQRSSLSGYSDGEKDKPVEERLQALMQFLRKEVKGAERLSYVRAGLDLTSKYKKRAVAKRIVPDTEDECPTAAGLAAIQSPSCIFCAKAHESKDCIKAQNMTIVQKREKVQNANACFRCLKIGHTSKRCRSIVRCILCTRKHLTLMCPDPVEDKSVKEKDATFTEKVTQNMFSQSNSTNVFLLQTVLVKLRCGKKQKVVRALCDSGSQRSYVLKSTVDELGLKSTSSTNLCHMLFGGSQESKHHEIFEIDVGSVSGHKFMKMQVLDQSRICGSVPRIKRGPWMSELKQHGIFISDLRDESSEIELLIGADYYATLITGRKFVLSNGLTAVETSLGWTLSGKIAREAATHEGSLTMTTISMLVQDIRIKAMWDLETIGIRDPIETVSKQQRDFEIKQEYFNNIGRLEDGRYTVPLPWIQGHPEIPDNRMIAEKRLQSTSLKLVSAGKFEAYDEVMNSWITANFIEKTQSACESGGHYLPHRAVYKPNNTTTPLRPVFDASCKAQRSPSLNSCLEKGANLLELLPNVLLRFREKTVGVTADIKKAFQMIEVDEKDRDYLKFLWWEDYEKKKHTTFRHKRVVFGLTCSPFILGAVIEFHLRHVPESDKGVSEALLRSFYVDNCVLSVNSDDEYGQFKQHATKIMASAKMELCQWECSGNKTDKSGVPDVTIKSGVAARYPSTTSVLGLRWDKVNDTLSCEVPEVASGTPITKRTILSFVSRLFDPIGFICPALLVLKLILQKAWATQLGWDDELPDEGKRSFIDWQKEIEFLRILSIPRHMKGDSAAHQDYQLHVFGDASQEAYAAVVYLRTRTSNEVSVQVQLLAAKTRVAPIKGASIPRLELMGCVIAVRLAKQVRDALTLPDLRTFYWSDSTTAIAWIKRHDEWGTFVSNRVKEIRMLTNLQDWRHIPGSLNPADLPSRGCTPKQLLESRWWEGPTWLKKPQEDWPNLTETVKEEDVAKERSKCSTPSESMAAVIQAPWYVKQFSSYHRNVRVVSWILRFVNNAKRVNCKSGPLTHQEVLDSEQLLFRLVQQETFPKDSKLLTQLRVIEDKEGIIRVGTKLFHADIDSFRTPILLPGNHPLVEQLIRHEHLQAGHAGVQHLMSILREKVWILRSRQTIRRVLRQCKRCLRFTAKNYSPDSSALPENRTNMVEAFQVVGIDLAGPLYLKRGQKAWIVLFTCAVYRCVHLDWVLSLSTEAFLEALQRFICTRGRPSVIYTDNGTNFVGSNNVFRQLNWEKIEHEASVRQIKWIFNPPAASWWGGWWERLIRTTKDLLRRMLGRSRINSEELRTCLSVVEGALNDRPLTTVTEDSNDLIPLTPAMFLRGIASQKFPELQELGSKQLQENFRSRQNLLQELRNRFRKEYLSQLVQRAKERVSVPNVGDIVLVGQDNKKRLEWPLARVMELIPGRDGKVRVARVKTNLGILTRPVQKLYPLEVSTAIDFAITKEARQVAVNKAKRDHAKPDLKSSVKTPVQTRYGRLVKKPVSFQAH